MMLDQFTRPEEMSLTELEDFIAYERGKREEADVRGALVLSIKIDQVLIPYERELRIRYHALGRFLSDH